jgi:hypothetical protein
MKKIIINSWIASLLRSIGRIFVTAGNNPVRDYSSVATFDCTAPRMTSVMLTNAASLRDAGEGGEHYFLPSFASLRDAGEGGERYFLPNFASLRDASSPVWFCALQIPCRQ